MTGVVLLAVWIRFQFIVMNGGLEESYLAWAENHYFGGLTHAYQSAAAALREFRPYPSLSYPPGYPALLAVLESTFHNLQTVRVAQATLEAAAGVSGAYRVARLIDLPRSWSVLAATFYAVYPPIAIGAGFLTAEAFTPALMLWSLLAIAWAAKRPSALRMCALGGILCCVSFVRPDLILLGGFAAVWFWATSIVPRTPALISALALGFFAVLLPWGVHNRVVHNAWVFTSTGGGTTLWEGLGELPNPYGYVLDDDYTANLLQSRGYSYGTPEGDAYMRREYVRAWREHPEFVLEVIQSRWHRILRDSENLNTPFQELPQFLRTYGVGLWLLGLALAPRRWYAVLVIGLPVLYALTAIGLVHYEERYVRYVHVAYALAGLVVLTSVTRLGGRRVTFVKSLMPAVVWSGAVLYGIGQLTELRADAAVERFEKSLADSRVTDATTVLFPSSSLLARSGAVISGQGDAFVVTADAARSEYLALQHFDVPVADIVSLVYDLTVESGAATVGLLGENGQWLTTTRVSPGESRRSVASARLRGDRRITAVIGGANRAPVRFRLVLREFRTVVYPPVSVADFSLLKSGPDFVNAVRQLLQEPDAQKLFVEIPPMGNTSWRVVGSTAVRAQQSGISIAAPPSTTEFLILRPYALSAARAVVLSYHVKLHAGAITVGMLVGQSAWKRFENLTQPGEHQGHIIVTPSQAENVNVVIAAANATPTPTTVDLLSLQVRVVP